MVIVNRIMRHKIAAYLSEGALIQEGSTPSFVILMLHSKIITIDSYGGTVI
jgi:hypothetical protein